jgi:hypothetical protein
MHESEGLQVVSSQPGLEVLHPTGLALSVIPTEKSYSDQISFEISEVYNGTTKGRICGLRRRIFWALIVVVVIAIGVGAGVGGSIAKKNKLIVDQRYRTKILHINLCVQGLIVF